HVEVLTDLRIGGPAEPGRRLPERNDELRVRIEIAGHQRDSDLRRLRAPRRRMLEEHAGRMAIRGPTAVEQALSARRHAGDEADQCDGDPQRQRRIEISQNCLHFAPPPSIADKRPTPIGRGRGTGADRAVRLGGCYLRRFPFGDAGPWTAGGEPCDTRAGVRRFRGARDDIEAMPSRRGLQMKNRIEDRSNKSGNRPFRDVLSRYLSRRDVLRGGLQSAAAAFFASSPGRSLAARKPGAKARPGLMDFTPLPVAGGGGKVPRIAPDYEMQILIPWGEPINPSSGPAVQWPPSAADQEKQVGIGHDGMWFFSLEGSERGLLVLNHEYGMSRHILGRDPQSLDDVRVSQHAHGITIVELVRRDGRWQHVDSRYARRIHVNTPVEFSGPAAGSPLLRNPARNAF